MGNKNNRKPKKVKYVKTANPDLAAAMQELRRSSATSPHDTRPNRQRTRQDAKKASIKDSKDI